MTSVRASRLSGTFEQSQHACHMCNEDNSLSWTGNGRTTTHILDLKTVTDSYDFSKIQHLKLLGGETLISPNFATLLDFLNTHQLSSQINLELITNGKVFPAKETINHLAKFKSCRLCISIDGIGPVAEYIRHKVIGPLLLITLQSGLIS